MKLKEFSVTNFRSIIRTEKFNLGDFTVLVGPNNEGKSNILRAIDMGVSYVKEWAKLPNDYSKSTITHLELFRDRFTPEFPASSRGTRYSYARDFPRHHKNYDDASGQTLIRLTFDLTPEESAKFKAVTGSLNNGTLPIGLTLTKASVKLEILKPGRGNSILAAKSVQIAQEVTSGLDFQYVPAVRITEDTTQLVTALVRRQLRTLALEDDYKRLTSELNQLRDKAISQIDKSLVASLQTFLPQLNTVRIVTQDSRDTFRVREIFLDDGVETPLSQKGDGVQSLAAISLMQESASSASAADSFILAVEEPESHLHPEAVHEVRQRLSAIAANQQVVISTHSPLLVNRNDYSSNIIVEKNKARSCKSLGELRECLGVQLADNLVSARLAILVEGLTDETVLRAVFSHRSKALNRAFQNQEIVFIPVKGAGKLANRLSALRPTITPTFVVFDKDASGQDAISSCKDQGLIGEGDYTILSTVGMKESELEDLYEPSVTLEAILVVAGVQLKESDLNPRKQKWALRIEKALNTHGVIIYDDTLEKIKIAAAALVAADPAASLKPAWSQILDSLIPRVESKIVQTHA